jgi:maltose O-acetyltransferase
MKYQGFEINFEMIKVGILGQLATSLWFLPKLSKIMHKYRGVNFKNINKVFIGKGVYIDNKYPKLVSIGEDVVITGNSIILSHSETSPYHKLNFQMNETSKNVIIEDGVFIGVGSIILPGVTIKKGAYIAAGSVVTKNVEENNLVAGNPAKVLKIIQKEF